MLAIVAKREMTTFLGGKVLRGMTAFIVILFLVGGAVLGHFIDAPKALAEIPTGGGNTLQANPVGYLLGTVANIFIFMSVILGVQMINQGIVEEKQSRVVEILLTTVKPRTLLLGKVLGVGTGVLVVFACYLGGFVGGLALAGLIPSTEALGALGVWQFLPTMIIWVALGFFTAATISGALAATVSRQEDLGSVQVIVMLLVMVPFYVAMYLTPNAPESMWNIVLTYVPFFSPSLVPMRVGMGDLPVIQNLIAMAITIVAIPLLARLGGMIYERSVLRTGSRVPFKELLKKA